MQLLVGAAIILSFKFYCKFYCKFFCSCDPSLNVTAKAYSCTLLNSAHIFDYYVGLNKTQTTRFIAYFLHLIFLNLNNSVVLPLNNI